MKLGIVIVCIMIQVLDANYQAHGRQGMEGNMPFEKISQSQDLSLRNKNFKTKHKNGRGGEGWNTMKSRKLADGVTPARKALPKPFQGYDYNDNEDPSWPCTWTEWETTACYRIQNTAGDCEKWRFRKCRYKPGMGPDGCCCKGATGTDRDMDEYIKCDAFECT